MTFKPKDRVVTRFGFSDVLPCHTATVREVTDDGLLIVAWDDYNERRGLWHPSRFAPFRPNGIVPGREATTPKDGSEAVTGDSPDSESMSRGDALAHGERMEEYGHPRVSFDRIAALWSAYLSAPEVDPATLTGENVGMLMTLLKVSRSITDRKADTLDDIEGYVSCIRMIREPVT